MTEDAPPFHPPFRTAAGSAEQGLTLFGPEELAEQLKKIQSVTDVALAHLELDALLDELLRRIRAVLGTDTATVLLCTEGGEELAVRASQGLAEEVEAHVRIPMGQGIAGRVAKRREAVIVDDVSRVEVARPVLYKLRSMMVAPLLVEGRILGVLHTGTFEPRRFSDWDLHLLQIVADRAALAIRNALLYTRVQAETAERAESEARFRVFAESASDAIFTMDEQSVLHYANPAAERIFGYPPEALIGQSMTILIPDRMRAAHRAGVEHHSRTGERSIPWTGVELPGLHRDGHEVPLEISYGEYVRDGKRFYTGIARDITERIRHQQALEETAAELETTVHELRTRTEEAEAANRAKTDFLAVMSHELRTPLNAIIGYAELLQLGLPEPIPEAAQRQVGRIDAAARHQLGLIEEILTFARLTAGREDVQTEAVDLGQIVRDATSFALPAAETKGLAVHVHAPASLVLSTDPGKVRQVLVNLLSNAIKFTPAGEIRVWIGTTADEAQVHIRDAGIGIAPEHLERVFEPFWQVQQDTTREAEGAGLGLTVSRSIARLLGGDLSVESTPGEGATFTLHLPLQRIHGPNPA